MIKRCFYQSNHLSPISTVNQKSVIFQVNAAPLVEQRFGTNGKTVLLATTVTNSVVHAMCAAAYTPYGYVDLHEYGPLLAFNGQARDPVTACDLLGNGKRVFNPVIMRFHSPDNYSPFGLGGVNAYAYCSGDPINHTDPTGNMLKSNSSGSQSIPTLKQLASNALARLHGKPVAVVAPIRRNEVSGGHAQRGVIQQPEQPAQPRPVPLSPALPRDVEGFFSNEELNMATHVFQVTSSGSSSSLAPFNQNIMITFIAHRMRQGIGGTSPLTIGNVSNIFGEGAPATHEHFFNVFERGADYLIDGFWGWRG